MMELKKRLQGLKLDRVRIFWLVMGIFFVAYLLLQRNLLSLLAGLVALLVAITVHEFAHAWVADQLGDPTARLLGRVSLNPLVHLDPLGTVMILITMFTGMGIGWGKPVPVTPYRLRYGSRLGQGLVALAGPASNLILALVLGLALRFLLASLLPGWALLVVATLAATNVIIGMFNLLPIPPLDGFSILLAILSLFRGQWVWNVSQSIASLQRYGPLLLLGVIFFSQFLGINIIGWWVGPPLNLFYRLILRGVGY